MMEIVEGYKQTEVGLIPTDWQEKRLEDVSKLSSGTTPSRKLEERYYFNGKTNWVKTTDLNNSHIFYTQEKITELALNESCLKEYSIGTVLVAMYGGFNQIGRTGLLKITAAVNQALIAIQPQRETLDSIFLINYLNFRVSYWKNVAISSRKDPNITSRNVKEFPIPLPPLPEQKAIAQALSDVDAAIAELDRLITKKRNIKQGTMQQLLTGKTRLPGFGERKGYKKTEVGVIPEGWEVVIIKDITSLVTNRFVGKATDYYTNKDDGILYIQGYNVEENSFNLHGIKKVTPQFHYSHQKSCLKKDDLLTIQTGEVGLTTIVNESLAGSNCHALIISRFQKEKAYPLFYSYYFNSSRGRLRLKGLEVGTTMKHINVGDLLSWKVPYLPQIREQKAIAQVLSDMDTEIEALEQKRNKYKAIKQGMMQELLTGRTRLI